MRQVVVFVLLVICAVPVALAQSNKPVSVMDQLAPTFGREQVTKTPEGIQIGGRSRVRQVMTDEKGESISTGSEVSESKSPTTARNPVTR